MNVVVWEWQEVQSIWIPYSVKVSLFLEMSSQKGLIVVNLGEVDQSLACYDVDLKMKTQTRRETGMIRQIKRSLYPAYYPCGQGIGWQWFNDFRWISYDMETAHIIEKQYQKDCKSTVDLEFTSLGIPNFIDLSRMVQVNKFTSNERPSQRKVNISFQYPIGNVNLAVKSASLDAYKNSTSLPFSASSYSNYSTSSSSGLSVNIHATSRSKEKLQSEAKRMKIMAENCNNHQLHLYCKATTKLDDLDEDCSICFEKLKDVSGFQDSSSNDIQLSMDVRELKKCPHKFHGTCLLALAKTSSKEGWMQCPTCKVIQGIKLGIQPKDGTMNVSRQGQSLPGHLGCGMVTITYNFTSGIQGPEHPHPGKRYYASGFPRQCYLPDNSKGQKVLKLLQKAWKRRLIFTIATSNTTGQEDSIVWNEIHHKTEPFSNISGHGFPDPNYLDNVLTELSIQGVGDNDQEQE